MHYHSDALLSCHMRCIMTLSKGNQRCNVKNHTYMALLNLEVNIFNVRQFQHWQHTVTDYIKFQFLSFTVAFLFIWKMLVHSRPTLRASARSSTSCLKLSERTLGLTRHLYRCRFTFASSSTVTMRHTNDSNGWIRFSLPSLIKCCSNILGILHLRQDSHCHLYLCHIKTFLFTRSMLWSSCQGSFHHSTQSFWHCKRPGSSF